LAHTYRQSIETHTDSAVHGVTEHRLSLTGEGKHSLERRDKIDIILAILEITNQAVKKTHILYTAKINFYQLSRYLELLLNIGLVEEISQPFEGYRITEKGRLMLNLFGRIWRIILHRRAINSRGGAPFFITFFSKSVKLPTDLACEPVDWPW